MIQFQRRKAAFRRRCELALVLTALTATHAGAIAPPFIPDDELAQKPIIVVGRWNKAPLKERSGDVYREYEIHTALLVERVIAGHIKPGTHKMLLGRLTGWPRDDGGPVMSFTSTEMIGDVEEVADLNLWFLVPKKSWDKTDGTTYLRLDTYRGVQPLQLERYFCALRAQNPKQEVPKLLASDEPVLIERVLRYLNGDMLPWPYDPGIFERHQGVKRRWEPMTQFAGEVEQLLQRKQPEVRRKAAAVYAEFTGKSSLPRMRELLGDSDPNVRAIAIGTLARHDDRASSEDICRAARGVHDGHMACEAIKLLLQWRNLQTVPALMSFLQNDAFAYQYGDDLGVPALKAQAALKELTGHDFPADVEASQKAWEKAKAIGDVKKRAAYLAQTLPYDPQPLEGKLVKEGKRMVLLLTNRSKRAVLVAKEPTSIGGQTNLDKGKTKDAYANLAPGGVLRVNMEAEWTDDARLQRVTVDFLDSGHQLGLKAWIGRVVLVLGAKQEPAGSGTPF